MGDSQGACFVIHPLQEDRFMPKPLSADIRARF